MAADAVAALPAIDGNSTNDTTPETSAGSVVDTVLPSGDVDPTAQATREMDLHLAAAPAPQQTPDRVLVVGSDNVSAARQELVTLFSTAGVVVAVDTSPERPAVAAVQAFTNLEATFVAAQPAVPTPPVEAPQPADPSATATSTTVAAPTTTVTAPAEPPVEVAPVETTVIVALGGYDSDPVVFAQSVNLALASANPQDTVVWVVDHGTGADQQRAALRAAQETHPNLQVADWATFAGDREEWFSGQGLSMTGRSAFSRFLTAAIFDRGVAD